MCGALDKVEKDGEGSVIVARLSCMKWECVCECVCESLDVGVEGRFVGIVNSSMVCW